MSHSLAKIWAVGIFYHTQRWQSCHPGFRTWVKVWIPFFWKVCSPHDTYWAMCSEQTSPFRVIQRNRAVSNHRDLNLWCYGSCDAISEGFWRASGCSMKGKQSIHTGLRFERKSMLKYSSSLYIAAVCAPLQQGMRGPLIHLLGTHLGEKNHANFTFTRFSLHSVSWRGFSLPLKSVPHFCLKEENSNKVTFELNSWAKRDIKKMLRKQCWRKCFFRSVNGYQGKIQGFMCIEKKVEITLILPEWNYWFPIFLLIRLLFIWLG